MCEDKRWRWSFRGCDIVLRDEADKVVLWLDRFKSAGDVVANVAPLHVGLPWAGVRILLEMAVSESRQMAALLKGMALVLSIASRLEVYIMYHRQLLPALATTNFEEALAMTYTHIMSFFAAALQEYEKATTMRFVHALWHTSTLETFENENDQLAARLETEASNCDRELSAQRWQEAQQWKKDLTIELQKLDAIQGMRSSLTSLHVKVDLSKLVIVEGATYNSYADANLARCLKGTRTDIIQQITDWADDPNGRCVFWLCGMAGTGKSTISRTIAHTFDQKTRLGASFFFKRNDGDRGNARRFFSTIAIQMADRILGLDQFIASAVDDDSFLSQLNIQEQFEKLLSQPLLSLPSQPAPGSVFVIVIDALDECDDQMDIRMIISLLTKLHAITSYRIRIFLTSRPELPIRLGFQDVDGKLHQDVKLEEVQATTINHDIRLFFQHSFKDIVKQDQSANPYAEPFPPHWPGDDVVDTLVNLAIPLFIFAFTVCRYISESDPRERLRRILQQDGNKSLTGIDKTYVPILNSIVSGMDERQRDEVYDSFQEVVGAIVLVGEPLSAQSYSSLLDLSPRKIGESLRSLDSVLNVPKDKNVPIRLFHLSFRDFLVDDEHSAAGRFKINERERHGRLAAQCFRRLSQEGILKDDLLRISEPGVRRAEIGAEQVESAIPRDVAYACSYWVFHVIESKQQIKNDGNVHKFLTSHLLHWLEALSWLGRLSNAVAHISDLVSATEPEQSSCIGALLNDAKRFLLQNRHIVDLAPLQLYYSALVFAPTTSIIRSLFSGQYASLLCRLPSVPSIWSAEIQKLEGHTRTVTAVAFSPDGQIIASGSSDKTIRLWDAKTGEERQKLTGHDRGVNAVAFSPDGQIVASASEDKTIRLWDAKTGEEKQKLVGHEGFVNAVEFLPDGQIASASDDKTIRLWDTKTGEEGQKLIGHKGRVKTVAFSPDGQMVVSGSYDGTILLWNVKTGEVQKLIEHEDYVGTVAFLPDGQIAYTLGEKTIRLWDVKTGEVRQNLVGHADDFYVIAFSPDGQIVASGSDDDKIVQLWDMKIGKERQKLIGHADMVIAVAFSPDGQIVVSGSFDRTIRLWDVKTGEVQKLIEHEDYVGTVAFLPDGQIASTSEDKTIRPWSTKTEEKRGHADIVSVVEFSPDGQIVASASLDKTIRLWDAKTGEQWLKVVEQEDYIKGIFFSPDGQIVVSTLQNLTTRLWDTKTGEERQNLVGHTDDVGVIAFSPDGQIVASTSDDRIIRLWDAKTGEAKQKLVGHEGNICAIAFSLDGQIVLSASGDRTIRLWDAKTGEEKQKLVGQEGFIYAVTSPDRQIVVSVSNYGTIRLWDAKTGEHSEKVGEFMHYVYAITFSPDGQIVAFMSHDGRLRLWDAKTGEQRLEIKAPGRISDLAFAPDGQSLETNIGRLDLSESLVSPQIPASWDRLSFCLRGEWLGRNNRDELWLPHEYRGTCWAENENLIVIGQVSGAMTFIESHQPATHAIREETGQ